MQQVTISTPKDKAKPVAKIALAQGISEVTVARVFVHGPDEEQEELTINCSVAQAAEIIEAVMAAPFYDPQKYSITSDELTAIVTTQPPESISLPFKMSSMSVLQDLWMQNQITVAYFARATVSAALLAYGLLEGDITTLIIAFLFTPFLTQDLAISFGLLMGDRKLAWRGAGVMSMSTVIAIAVGAIAAAIMGGPVQIEPFGTIQANFIISFLVGIVAGLDTADVAGRREFVAVAGAAQFAAFPVWFGISLIAGFPDAMTTYWRIATFFINIVTILVVAMGVYAWLKYRRENVREYIEAARK